MRVTVAICTYNRATSLERTLASLTALRVPNDVTWEVLVVDNNSTDGTPSVIDRFRNRLPLHGLFESVPGKSRAANRAAQESTGDIILWTDDDVIVDVHWLAEYVRAAEDWPAASYFGGTVDPWFESSPPPWISSNIGLLTEPFALAQHGPDTFALGELAVVGANMATRRDIFQAFSFDTALGPTGTCALRGEETDLLGRLRYAGYTGLWVGSARVKHCIAPERLTVDYLWHWYGGLGTYVAVRDEANADVARVFGVPRWALHKYSKLLAKYWMLAPTRSVGWLQALREAALMKGYLEGARKQRSTQYGLRA